MLVSFALAVFLLEQGGFGCGLLPEFTSWGICPGLGSLLKGTVRFHTAAMTVLHRSHDGLHVVSCCAYPMQKCGL